MPRDALVSSGPALPDVLMRFAAGLPLVSSGRADGADLVVAEGRVMARLCSARFLACEWRLALSIRNTRPKRTVRIEIAVARDGLIYLHFDLMLAREIIL